MQIELNLAELKEIVRCLNEQDTQWFELADRLTVAAAELEDLESLDFDDCAGGACKL